MRTLTRSALAIRLRWPTAGSEYQGELQLSAGKFGQLKVLEKGAGKPAEAPKETPKDDKDDDEPSQAPYKDEEMVEDGDKEEEYY